MCFISEEGWLAVGVEPSPTEQHSTPASPILHKTPQHTNNSNKVKKERFIYTAPELPPQRRYCHEPAYSIRHSPSPHSRTLVSSHTVACCYSLSFLWSNPIPIHVNTSTTTHFTDPGRMEGWVGWPTADSFLTKWSPINHRLGTGQEKSVSERLTS